MSLSILLARAQPLVEAALHAPGGRLAPPFPAHVLFFSLCDGRERATVLHVCGADAAGLWRAGAALCQRHARQAGLRVAWLRVDWVTGVRATQWGGLAQQLRQTKRNYFRHGLAFDAGLAFAFLEQELNANAMLYGGADDPQACLNPGNFARYAQRRYGSRFVADWSDAAPVYVLDTEGLFVADDPALAALPGGTAPQRLAGPGLDAGRRCCAPLDADAVLALIRSGSDFLARQVQADGTFIYGRFPCFGRRIPAYNALRHASSLYAMLEAYELTQDAALFEAIRRGLDYLTGTLIRVHALPGGGPAAFLVDGDETKLGGNAVSLLALVKYTELSGDRQYLPLLDQLALGIAHQQDAATGAFVHVLHAADLSLKAVFRTIYYDGEAAFGLMRLYGLTHDARWLEMVRKAFAHFLRADHWKAHDHWLSYCANELTRYLPEARYFRFGVRNIADHLDFILKRETTYPTLLELAMAFEQMLTRLRELTQAPQAPQEPHSPDAVPVARVEGVENAENVENAQSAPRVPQLAGVLDGFDVEAFHRALHHRAHYLLNGFFWPEFAMYFQRPASVVGSFFIRHHAFRVRIDDIEHYLSGYVAYWKYLRRQAGETAAGHTHAGGEVLPPLPVPLPAGQAADPLAGEGRAEARGARDASGPAAPRPSLDALRRFDPAQLFRLFVDGRFHKKYEGWVGYEAGERGSVQALLDGLSLMVDRFDLSAGLETTYLLALHKTCMAGVHTRNLKSSPGDLRFLNAGMPFFAKTTTRENIHEILAMRRGDGTAVFNTAGFDKPAEQLDADAVYAAIQARGKLNYRNWYPELDAGTQAALRQQRGLSAFYEAKHHVQMQFARRVEAIVARFNASIAATYAGSGPAATSPAPADGAAVADARLHAIALLVRELELLHPFPDGNCRTVACVLLTQLLLNHGFPPALLENPNLDGEYSLAQWIGEIRNGMAAAETLLRDPSARVYGYAIGEARAEHRAAFAEMARELVGKLSGGQAGEQAGTLAEKRAGADASAAAGSVQGGQGATVAPAGDGAGGQGRFIHLDPERLARYTGGQWLTPCPAGLRFTGVGTYNTYGKGNVYFALEIAAWEKDGKPVREVLARIVAKGVCALVLDRAGHADGWPVPVLLVEDAFAAFKAAAVATRQALDPLTLLITGTEGKTGAKVQLHHVLNFQTRAHGVINSANTEVPVLRSLANLGEDDLVEINEVSVGGDEAYRVERAVMVNPDVCLFTHIGPNHMDLHKTMDNLLWAKSSVVAGLREGGVCIVDSHNPHSTGLRQAILKRMPSARIVTYGMSPDDAGQLLGAQFDAASLGWRVHARIDGDALDYVLPLPQRHAPLASVGVLLAVRRAGFDAARAAADYASLQPYETMGRLLRLPKAGGEVLFYDQSRRGGISGMRSAFADIASFKVSGRVVALVGGISVLRDGDWTRDAHRQLAGLINDSPIERLYTTGNYIDYVHQHLHRPPVRCSHDVDELAGLLHDELRPGDLLFIIGSAYLYLGRVAERLQQALAQGRALPRAAVGDGPHAAAWRMLKVYEDVAKGTGPVKASAANGVLYTDYQAMAARHADHAAYRGSLLQGFFSGLDALWPAEAGLRAADEALRDTDWARHVATPVFCRRWFNNLDKKPQVRGKQAFGRFFDFGDPDHLLHVEVATVNLHAGLVRCRRTATGWTPEAMDEAGARAALARYPGLRALGARWRDWGPRWLSVDLGRFIDTGDPAVFLGMVDTANSPLQAQYLRPIVEALAQAPKGDPTHA